jgi:ribonucleoside-diphosphate reductase beta chain
MTDENMDEAKDKKVTIFDEQISLKPNRYPWAQQFIEAMHNSFWTDKEFNFQSDVHDFRTKLSKDEQDIIIRSLATIGQLEISVKKYWSKLGDNLPHPALYDLGYVMANTEVIHGNAYARLLEVLGITDAFEDILKLPMIQGRVNYLKKHTHKFHSDNKKQFIYSLILFTLFVENISLFSQFYTINWFGRYKNLLKDTNKQVEYTSREEDLHAKIGIKLIKTIREEYPELFDDELKHKILYEADQAVKYECEIFEWIIGDYNTDKLNATIGKELVKKRMNDSLVEIGYPTIFVVDNELLKKTDWFDEQLYGNNMTDFFNSRATEYSKKSQSFGEEDLF